MAGDLCQPCPTHTLSFVCESKAHPLPCGDHGAGSEAPAGGALVFESCFQVQIYTPPEKLPVPMYLLRLKRMRKGFSCIWANADTGFAFISAPESRTGEAATRDTAAVLGQNDSCSAGANQVRQPGSV